MKLSKQKLEQAKKLLFEIQVYFDAIIEIIGGEFVKASIIDIAYGILKSIKNKLDKYSDLPIEKKKLQRKILKSIRIKYLYIKALLIGLQCLYSDDNYPTDRLTDFAILNLDKFYDVISWNINILFIFFIIRKNGINIIYVIKKQLKEK